jgi:hypothetical protein
MDIIEAPPLRITSEEAQLFQQMTGKLRDSLRLRMNSLLTAT